MTEIIFHHYWSSPFSEKVRIVFGMKKIAWRSVEIPNMMPKPDLMPLTGGYRKTPVMQIGSDVYCDTQLIIRELEHRFPDTPVVHHGGLSYALAFWSDRPFFQATVPLIFGELGPMIPEAFKKDREQMFPERPFNHEQMKALSPAFRDQWRAHIALINDSLSPDCTYLAGNEPTIADAHCYMNLWFYKNPLADAADAMLQEFPAVQRWFEAVKAIGHGTYTSMDAKEALAIAKLSKSIARPRVDPFDPNGRKPGTRVSVMADDYGRDPVIGELVFSSAHEIAVKRHSPEAGDVVVHFPRAGFIVLPA